MIILSNILLSKQEFKVKQIKGMPFIFFIFLLIIPLLLDLIGIIQIFLDFMNNIYHKPILVAEIGCNHKGDINLAKQLIVSAANCGAQYAKFQIRDNKYLLGDDYRKPHPVPENSYGKTYGAHREYLEFSINQHKQLMKFCKKNKIKYATSVWDLKSAEKVCKQKISSDYIKIPSACNLDFELLNHLCKYYKGKIHISLGMTTDKEVKKILSFLIKKKRNKDTVFYICTSDYPSDFTNLNLLEISKKKSLLKNKISSIAFSGHHLGIAPDIAAYVLGASYIERHFTIDRTWKGTDHAASLEPPGLSKLSRDLQTIYTTLTYKKKQILDCEKIQRKKLKRFVKI